LEPIQETVKSARIFIVDDELINVRVLTAVVKKDGFTNVTGITDSREVTRLFQELRPDIVLLDLMMPHIDGFEVMEQLKPLMNTNEFLPILVLTADWTLPTKHKALTAGANDFVTKPFDSVEVILRIRNLLQIRTQHQLLQEQKRLIEDQNLLLEEKVYMRTKELEIAQTEVVHRLAQANEFRDDNTGGHIRRVAYLTAAVARQLGFPENQACMMSQAAMLHDVGKIGTPDGILLKPAKLTDPEFETMRSHTTRGANLLAEGHSEVIKMAQTIALTHHERWDGKGYPAKLKGEEIPVEGRIVAAVDVLDALTHERPYKKAWTLEEALREIQSLSGRHFDPKVVQALCALPIEVLSYTRINEEPLNAPLNAVGALDS
jgi:putative two-component system response regulator